jgi:hypothetical protein
MKKGCLGGIDGYESVRQSLCVVNE